MVLLILESLGSTELIFILIMALVFLDRASYRSSAGLGKNLASFRRASEDFKRTWDREVTMEELNFSRIGEDQPITSDNSILDTAQSQSLQEPTIQAIPTERVKPRESVNSHTVQSSANDVSVVSEPPGKRDWL